VALGAAVTVTIYVDQLVGYGPAKDPQARRVGARHGHRWCHMFADTSGPDGDAALIAFARQIGLKPEWFQKHPLGNHFDLTPTRREAAVKAGAKECTNREGVDVRRRARGVPTVAEQVATALVLSGSKALFLHRPSRSLYVALSPEGAAGARLRHTAGCGSDPEDFALLPLDMTLRVIDERGRVQPWPVRDLLALDPPLGFYGERE
jgi:hypothetical protein